MMAGTTARALGACLGMGLLMHAELGVGSLMHAGDEPRAPGRGSGPNSAECIANAGTGQNTNRLA